MGKYFLKNKKGRIKKAGVDICTKIEQKLEKKFGIFKIWLFLIRRFKYSKQNLLCNLSRVWQYSICGHTPLLWCYMPVPLWWHHIIRSHDATTPKTIGVISLVRDHWEHRSDIGFRGEYRVFFVRSVTSNIHFFYKISDNSFKVRIPSDLG